MGAVAAGSFTPHREVVSGGEAGKDLGAVLKASKRGEAGDADKNGAIVKMVDDFNRRFRQGMCGPDQGFAKFRYDW